MNIKIFYSNIIVKEEFCSLNGNKGEKIDVPYVNVYVRVCDNCNANCHFCTFNGSDKGNRTLDPYKLYYTLKKVSEKVKINKVSFTGGEPTLYFNDVVKAMKLVKEIDKNIFIVMNTNGFMLERFVSEGGLPFVDSIALSVHHYNHAKNDELFGVSKGITNSIDAEKALILVPEEKLHISCNLVRGYIDCAQEAYHFINHFSKLGCTDFGFVALMKVNDYAKKHHIDFSEVELQNMPNTIKTKSFDQNGACKCNNFLTYNENGDICKVYARYYVNPESKCETVLVYDRDKLLNGFGGHLIYN